MLYGLLKFIIYDGSGFRGFGRFTLVGSMETSENQRAPEHSRSKVSTRGSCAPTDMFQQQLGFGWVILKRVRLA